MLLLCGGGWPRRANATRKVDGPRLGPAGQLGRTAVPGIAPRTRRARRTADRRGRGASGRHADANARRSPALQATGTARQPRAQDASGSAGPAGQAAKHACCDQPEIGVATRTAATCSVEDFSAQTNDRHAGERERPTRPGSASAALTRRARAPGDLPRVQGSSTSRGASPRPSRAIKASVALCTQGLGPVSGADGSSPTRRASQLVSPE